MDCKQKAHRILEYENGRSDVTGLLPGAYLTKYSTEQAIEWKNRP